MRRQRADECISSYMWIESEGRLSRAYGVGDGETDSAGLVAAVASGEAAGLTFSVFCSQAASSAAPAKRQIYFFIALGLEMHSRLNPDSEQERFSALHY